jgi:HNH endonuclease
MVTYIENVVNTGNKKNSQPRTKLRTEVLKLWDSDVPLASIAQQAGCRQPTVKSIFVEEHGLLAVEERKHRLYQLSKLRDKNPQYGKRGSDAIQWKGGVAPTGTGYLTVVRPEWMTHNRAKRVLQHHVVWCLDRCVTYVPLGHSIHHIDQCKTNNVASNLVLMTTSEHTRLHAALRRSNDYPEMEYLQVGGSATVLLQREHDIVCSIWGHIAV